MNRDSGASHSHCLNLPTQAAFGLLLVFVILAFPPAGGSHETDEIALSRPLTIKWRYQSDRISNFTPATDGKTAYLPLIGGTMVALNGSDGKLRWKADEGGEFSAAPVTDDRSVYAATQYGESGGDKSQQRGTLRALSKETGVTRWMRTLPAPLRGSLVAGPGALFGGAADGRVYAFDKRTGLTLWINHYPESFSGRPALSKSLVYMGGDGGTLYALDQTTGRLVWHYRTRGPIQGAIAQVNGVISFGSGDGYVYAYSELRSKLIWRRRTGAAVQAVVPLENGFLAASLDNFAYLLSTHKGSLIWRQLLPGRISARPLTAPDGALFTPLSTDSAIVLGLKDGKPVNALMLGEENSSSAAPIAVDNTVLISTAHGILAFASPQPNP